MSILKNINLKIFSNNNYSNKNDDNDNSDDKNLNMDYSNTLSYFFMSLLNTLCKLNDACELHVFKKMCCMIEIQILHQF